MAARSAACRMSVPSGVYSGSPSPRIRFERSKTQSRCDAGMPIMSQMIQSGSGAEISMTKSHSPFSATRSTVAFAARCT